MSVSNSNQNDQANVIGREVFSFEGKKLGQVVKTDQERCFLNLGMMSLIVPSHPREFYWDDIEKVDRNQIHLKPIDFETYRSTQELEEALEGRYFIL